MTTIKSFKELEKLTVGKFRGIAVHERDGDWIITSTGYPLYNQYSFNELTDIDSWATADKTKRYLVESKIIVPEQVKSSTIDMLDCSDQPISVKYEASTLRTVQVLTLGVNDSISLFLSELGELLEDNDLWGDQDQLWATEIRDSKKYVFIGGDA